MKIQLAVAGSSVLYHLILMEHAITALKNDKFKLAPVNEGVESEFGEAQYFLSLARSKHSDYFKNEAGSTHVIFVLDGQKMNANYQIKAVDYWHKQSYVEHDEKEDRLFANKMYIPCIRYVKEIHFMKESGKFKSNDSLTLALLAKRNGIELFQYDEFKAFLDLDKRKKIKLDVSDKKKRKFGQKVFQPYSTGELEAWYVASQIAFKGSEAHYTQYLKGAHTKEEQKNRDRIGRQIKHLINTWEVGSQAVRDFNRLLEAAREGSDLQFLEKIKRVKRRLRVDTKGFLDYVRKRWMTPEEREQHGLD
ncbi:hypothetical protein D3C80_1120710 [compost metagenome]